MQNKLEKVGAASYAHPWRALIIWLCILAITITGAVMFMQTPNGSVSIPGTQADDGLTRMKSLFPEMGKGSARIAIKAPSGSNVRDYDQAINALVASVANGEGVNRVVSPFENPIGVSKDSSAAYVQVQLVNGSGDIADSTVEAIDSAVSVARQSGLTVEVGGDTVNNEPDQLLGIGELAGVLVALLVLLITFGSFVAAGLPIISAIFGVVVTLTGLFGLSKVVSINSTTPALAAMLGLAVGIDYSLFIISRYRSYLLSGMNKKLAAARAIRTAGSAVIFAASTVIIALAALSVVKIPFMTVMGVTGAAAVAVAALIAVTLLPAVFRLIGDKILSKSGRAKAVSVQNAKESISQNRNGFAHRYITHLVRHPWLYIIGAFAIIAAIAWPALSMTMGLPTDQYAAEDTTQRKAYDIIADGFGPGYNAPLIMVAENIPPVPESEFLLTKAALTIQLEQKISAESTKQMGLIQSQLQQASSPQEKVAIQAKVQQLMQAGETKKAEALKQIEQKYPELAKRKHLQSIADKVAENGDVEKVLVSAAADDGSYGIIQIIPKSAPYDHQTTDLISSLRDTTTQQSWGNPAASYQVTGSTAMQLDVDDKLAEALPKYLAIVVGLSFLILILAFRSILIPLKATIGYIFSVLAMFGALTAVFQWGWFGIADSPAPIVSFIPILASGILFGLAMDYEFFLVSGMSEEYVKTKNARLAIVNGFTLGSKVVVAAALIMFSVFAGFVTNEMNTVRALGFGLAVGILVDAFLVRMVLVPSVMHIMGKSAWWMPSWLGKLLPNIAIDEN